jgi:hypothetical protein
MWMWMVMDGSPSLCGWFCGSGRLGEATLHLRGRKANGSPGASPYRVPTAGATETVALPRKIEKVLGGFVIEFHFRQRFDI